MDGLMHQRFISELINLYHNAPALWDVKSPEYKNKEIKRESYNILVRKCREYVNDADLDFVKSKINCLRSSFRKEYKKYLRSKQDSDTKVYVPKLWYYNMLLFTVDECEELGNVEKTLNLTDESVSFDLKNEPSSTYFPVEEDPLSVPSPIKRPCVDAVPDSVNDVYDAIGKNVAHKLREMSKQQRIIAEKIISDVMYYGQMESLTQDSHLAF